MESSDQKLITDYLKGDEKSLGALIERYLKPIYNFTRRYLRNAKEAEDITQEVFISVWRNLKKFDRKKNFKTWIFAIAKNACIDFFRKKKTIPFSEFENEQGENVFAEKIADPSPLPDELMERADMAGILKTAIRGLSSKYRMVLFLRYNDHFTFREIAESLGEPLETIKSRHRRALIMLKKMLAGL